jgi:hypothetical protein
MKALSVCQPWAWAIVHDIKMVENRWRRTNYRGPLVIHASRSRRYLEEDFADLPPGLPPVGQLDFGALVRVVEGRLPSRGRPRKDEGAEEAPKKTTRKHKSG